MPAAPSRSEENTIVALSGDQSGEKLLPAPNVRREFTERARSRIQMSSLPARASLKSNARRSPAEDRLGSP